jgi:hypothetical protein
MTSLELLKEIETWLCFNTEPSKEETTKLRKSIEEHVNEQLRIHDVVGRSEQLVCDECNGWGYTVDENGRRKAHCTKCD